MSLNSSPAPYPDPLSKIPPNVSVQDISPLVPEAPATEDMLPGLPFVHVKAVPRGTAKFEAKRAALLQSFASKVPEQLRLPLELIRNPPNNVTDIPGACGILSSEELAITEDYDAVSLLEAIANRKHTSVAVARAFCKRAIIPHQLTCCLT